MSWSIKESSRRSYNEYRDELQQLARIKKLALERRSINIFKSTARYFADPGEQGALVDDIVALMVLRHYHVPSRLLDWSLSPWVAAYFAVSNHDDKDGEIWAFDHDLYAKNGLNSGRNGRRRRLTVTARISGRN